MVAGIVKGALGVVQMVQGQQGLDSLRRPKYETPTEIKQMLGLDRQEYGDPTMPGQAAAQDRLDLSASAGMKGAMASGNTLASLAALQAQNQAGQIGLADTAAKQQAQQLGAYKKSLGISAQYTDQEFQMNEYARFADDSAKFENMAGAGRKNIYGSLTEMGSIGDAMLSEGMKSRNNKAQDTSNIYDEYNPTGKSSLSSNTQVDSDPGSGYMNYDFVGNITNPYAKMPGYTWNKSAGKWEL